jgi:hypothetical protein
MQGVFSFPYDQSEEDEAEYSLANW